MTRVGFIGLGLMGRPMATNLVRAGFEVTVFNRSRPPMDALAAEGAQLATSAGEAGEGRDFVITMLPDGPDVEGVLAGEGGVFDRAAPGTLAIDMSTIAPRVARELHQRARARSLGMLDAPVSGGDVGARAATLSIMVGGEKDDFERAKPVFEALGKTITLCGPAGAGQLVKACNQIVTAIVIEGISEAIVFAERAGISFPVMKQVLQGGLAHTRVMEARGDRMAARELTPGFKAAHHLKDLRIVLEEARAMGLILPVTQQVRDRFAALVERGGGSLDNTALVTLLTDPK
jgi:2-hydroxy-3-oxopropionate reductase